MNGREFPMAVFIILSGIQGYCSGTTQTDSSIIYIPQISLIPKKCWDAGYCETDYNATYPTLYIESKLIGHTSEYPRVTETKYDSRDDAACGTKQKIVTCLVAKSLDGEWYFILNTTQFNQDILVGLCREENKPCSGVEDEYESKCLQHKVPKYLFALNHTGEIFHGGFMMPVHCVCVIEERN